MSNTRFYNIWHHMKQRCLQKNRKDFYLYGGRGITVCDEWKDFNNFKFDMYESYLKHINLYGEKQTTLDRINTNKGYGKSNCRWATIEQQLKNRRNYKNKVFVATDPQGKVYEVFNRKEFAEKFNLTISKISGCLTHCQKTHKGWTFKYKKGVKNESC